MALLTTITPEDIATALGLDFENVGDVERAQWEMWISSALLLIEARAEGIDPEPVIDQARLDYVIREAVVAHANHPDDATQVTVSVDDASTSRTYRSGSGRVQILDEWWTLLGLMPKSAGAFSFRPTGPAVDPLECRPDLWFQWINPTPPGAP